MFVLSAGSTRQSKAERGNTMTYCLQHPFIANRSVKIVSCHI